MPPFEKGNKAAVGRKSAKKRLTNDVRQVFHKVYDEMGKEEKHPITGEPLNGHEAMLAWARENKSEFYKHYAKMIPATAEMPEDMHEDFIGDLVFEEEQGEQLIEADATEVGNDDQLQLPSGETVPDTTPHEAIIPTDDDKVS